jgi:hypothetical protein
MSHMQKRERILALDLIRGYFLLVILLDHLFFYPSIFEVVTGRGHLWASAAEGFFMISGILVGYVYSPRMVKDAIDASKKMWRRALQLFSLSVIFSLIFIWWGNMIGADRAKKILWVDPNVTEVVKEVVTARYAYGWTDFLQYYALFMVFAPLAVYLCTKNYAWLVALFSFGVWLFRGENFTMGIQMMFMLGLVVGYYLPTIEKVVRGWSLKTQKRSAIALFGITGLSIGLSAITVRGSSVFQLWYNGSQTWVPAWFVTVMNTMYDFLNFTRPYVEKFTVAPLRVVCAIVWFTALYVFVRRYEQQINRYSKGFFRTLGQHSLFVYSFQGFIVFGTLAYLSRTLNIVSNTLYSIPPVIIVYLAAKYHRQILAKIVPKS